VQERAPDDQGVRSGMDENAQDVRSGRDENADGGGDRHE
jgi:hypothetical protein